MALDSEADAGAEHIVTELRAENGDVLSVCSCGAVWTHPASRPVAVRQEIAAAHATYGQRVKSVIL